MSPHPKLLEWHVHRQEDTEAPLEHGCRVHQVHVGQYGCKIPLQIFKEDFAALLSQPMAASAAVDLAWQARDPENIYVFGIQNGKCKLEVPGFGTLEVRASGRAGSEQGKCIQGYSPISHIIKAAGTYEAKLPTTMKALRSRKAGAMTLVDTILAEGPSHSAGSLGGCWAKHWRPHGLAGGEGHSQKAASGIVHGLLAAWAGSQHRCTDICWNERFRAQPWKHCAGGGLSKETAPVGFLASQHWFVFWPLCKTFGKWQLLPASAQEVAFRRNPIWRPTGRTRRTASWTRRKASWTTSWTCSWGAKGGRRLGSATSLKHFFRGSFVSCGKRNGHCIHSQENKKRKALCGLQVQEAMGAWQQIQFFALLPWQSNSCKGNPSMGRAKVVWKGVLFFCKRIVLTVNHHFSPEFGRIVFGSPFPSGSKSRKCKTPCSRKKMETYMGVSKNRGTPKWMVYNGKPKPY